MVPLLCDCRRTAAAEPSSIKALLFLYGNGPLNISGAMLHLVPNLEYWKYWNLLKIIQEQFYAPRLQHDRRLGPECSVSSGLFEVRASQDSMVDISYDRLLRNSSVGFTGCSVVILLTSTPDPWPDCVAQRSTMSTLSSLLPRVDKANSHSSSQSTMLSNLPFQGPSWPLSQLGKTAISKITPGSCRLLLFHSSWVSCATDTELNVFISLPWSMPHHNFIMEVNTLFLGLARTCRTGDSRPSHLILIKKSNKHFLQNV